MGGAPARLTGLPRLVEGREPLLPCPTARLHARDWRWAQFRRKRTDGAAGRTRTCDLLVRSQTLYPTELWPHRARAGRRLPAGTAPDARVAECSTTERDDGTPAREPQATRSRGGFQRTAAEKQRMMWATRRVTDALAPPTDLRIGSRWGATPTRGGVMEFLNLLLLFTAGVLIFRKPDRQALAFKLVITSVVLMIGSSRSPRGARCCPGSTTEETPVKRDSLYTVLAVVVLGISPSRSASRLPAGVRPRRLARASCAGNNASGWRSSRWWGCSSCGSARGEVTWACRS